MSLRCQPVINNSLDARAGLTEHFSNTVLLYGHANKACFVVVVVVVVVTANQSASK